MAGEAAERGRRWPEGGGGRAAGRMAGEVAGGGRRPDGVRPARVWAGAAVAGWPGRQRASPTGAIRGPLRREKLLRREHITWSAGRHLAGFLRPVQRFAARAGRGSCRPVRFAPGARFTAVYATFEAALIAYVLSVQCLHRQQAIARRDSSGSGWHAGPSFRQHHDSAASRAGADPQEFKGARTGNGKARACDVGGLTKECPALVRGAQDQQDTIHTAIALLQHESAQRGLTIVRRRLRLRTVAPSCASNHAIPSSRVARRREGNFGRPVETWMQQAPKLAKHGQVSCVADWLSSWKCLDREVQAHDRTEFGQQHDVDVLEEASLETAAGRGRHADSAADRIQRQISVDASQPDLPADRRS